MSRLGLNKVKSSLIAKRMFLNKKITLLWSYIVSFDMLTFEVIILSFGMYFKMRLLNFHEITLFLFSLLYIIRWAPYYAKSKHKNKRDFKPNIPLLLSVFARVCYISIQ